ncbi:hypothetical protein DPSP01_002180 [Paraphaeosphaeria sporulosa]
MAERMKTTYPFLDIGLVLGFTVGLSVVLPLLLALSYCMLHMVGNARLIVYIVSEVAETFGYATEVTVRWRLWTASGMKGRSQRML